MVRTEALPLTPPARTAASTTYRDAAREALRDALQRDDRVFLMGEDVGRYGGGFGVSLGLLEEFGEERIRDTPLSESAFVGAAIGAALGGMRPVVEIMTVNFSLLALDQLMNNAATLLHMSGGQFNVPLVVRMTTGAGRQLAAQHSHSLEGWYAHIPGLRILAPATLEDARGMLWTALQDPDPVLIWVDDELKPQDAVHLGVAVSLRSGGMVTPAIHDAQALSVDEMMGRLRDLVDRARKGRMKASELTDATLTVTNLGDQGVEEVLGVIYPPQVALVGFGTVAQRPWAVDGLLGVRPVVTATLSADHRATDGYVGARFLNQVGRLLQQPEAL